MSEKTRKDMVFEIEELRIRLEEAEETLRAIRAGEVDALVVSGPEGEQVYTLKGANQSYRVLVETMNEGTATIAPDGTILYGNNRLAVMLKIPLEQVIGTLMRFHITESDLPIYDDLLRKGLQTGCQGELSLKAGERNLPVQLSLSPAHSEGMDCAVMVITDLTEQKRAEESLRRASETLEVQVRERTAQLRESEERYRSIIELSPDAIVIHSEGRCVFVNPAAVRLFGAKDPNELIGKRVLDLVHPDFRELIKERIRFIEEKEDRTSSMEVKILRLDGSGTDVESSAAPVIYMGKPATQVIIRDITERRKAEDALKESERKFKSLAENAPDVIMRFDKNLRVLYLSPSAERATGIPSEKFIGKTNEEMGMPENLCRIWNNLFEKASATKTIQQCEFEFTGPAGLKIYDLQIVPELAEDGSVESFMGISRDVTERKKMEEALREYRDELEMRVRERTAALERAGRALKMLYECNQIIVRAVSETNFLRDICRIIVEVGGYRMAWVGFAEQDSKKTVRPVAQAGYEDGYLDTLNITWADTERGLGPTGTAVRTGRPSIGRNILTDPDFKPWRAEALKRGYASSISIPMITDGQTIGALTMYSVEPEAFDRDEVKLLKEMTDDVVYCIAALRLRAEHKRTDEELREHREHLEVMVEKRTHELKKISEELARSNRELEQFAYIASHDLKEPLRNIASFVGLLEKRYKDKLDEKAHEYIKYAVDGAKRMQDLIIDLLEYSKVGSKGIHFQTTDSSLRLSKAISSLRVAIEESGALVTYDKLPTLMADPSQLSSLFQNLIGNAIKYRGKEIPRIHVSAEARENEWLFSVRDNGIGIDPKFRDRIFAVFQRLHTSREYSGTGIGLAVCKKIVERHGGKIWVESTPPKGSTFFFTIPANS